MGKKWTSLLRMALVWAALVGCGAPEGAGKSETGDSGPMDSGTSGPTDEQVLREAIAGTRDAAGALVWIEASGGFPVESAAGTYLFACLCEPSGTWVVAGDLDGWAGQPMERSGELFWAEVVVDAPVDSMYKFHDTSAGDSGGWIADPLARRFGYDSFGEFSLVRANVAHLERWKNREGGGLSPRDARIWVPEGGLFDRVVYAHDGQNLFDPAAFWGGWQLQASLPPEILVVGIDNSPERMAEYTHVEDSIDGVVYGGRAEDYAVLVHNLRVDVEDRYGAASRVGLMGSSLGGLVSLVIADLEPDAWDFVISMSGTLGWGSIGAHEQTIIERYAGAGHRSFGIYLDSGGEGPCEDADGDGILDDSPTSSDNYCETRQMADTLSGIGYAWEEDLWHWHEPGAAHNEAAWAARVGRPLSIFAER